MKKSCLKTHAVYSILLVFLMALCTTEALASDKIIIDGSSGVKPLIESLAEKYLEKQAPYAISIASGLKPQARVQALLDNRIDIAMASHGINDQQISDLGLQVHKIAKVAVVIGVNLQANIRSITHTQLCNIYRGKVRNWTDLGGANRPIIPFIRPSNEVDTEIVNAHISCFSQWPLAADIQIVKRSGQMARAIAKTPGAIGMTTLVRVAQSEDKIHALTLNGIEPTTEHLINGDYTMTRDLFLITASKPSSKVSSFLTFIRSDLGSATIRSNNAVPAY